MSCSCLEFVGRSIWRILKFILAGLAVVGAILIFTSVPCSVDILKYIVAVVLLVAALFMIIDSAGVEALINKFRVLINDLRKEVKELKDIENQLNDDLSKMDKENKSYDDENKIHAGQLRQLQEQLDTQKGNNIELQNINNSYLISINSLKTALSEYQEQLIKITSENKAFANNNRIQKLQIDRLTTIEESAKRLIDGLMSAGGDLTRVSEIISADADKMETTSETMERVLRELEAEKQRVLQGLADDKFDEIDANHDGQITRDELQAYATRSQSNPNPKK